MPETRKTILVVTLFLGFLMANAAGRISAASLGQNATLASASTTKNASQTKGGLVYTNKTYGFRFALPDSWKGYSIIVKSWSKGPLILIRHPLWTEANRRQDIPIMVLTPAQWELVQEGKLSVSAAPIGPDELARNSKYVFALPPRYNFAFLPGYEEVGEILKRDPLQAF